MTKTTDFQCISFGHFVIRYSNLFRISDFDIRILPEYDFSFRHYLVFIVSQPCPAGFVVEPGFDIHVEEIGDGLQDLRVVFPHRTSCR